MHHIDLVKKMNTVASKKLNLLALIYFLNQVRIKITAKWWNAFYKLIKFKNKKASQFVCEDLEHLSFPQRTKIQQKQKKIFSARSSQWSFWFTDCRQMCSFCLKHNKGDATVLAIRLKQKRSFKYETMFLNSILFWTHFFQSRFS